MTSIARLTRTEINEIAAAFALLGWNKPASQYQSYLDEQNAGGRHVLVARIDGEFCGYVTLVTPSHCGEFSAMGIPEITDFNVLPKFRNRGIGTALMDAIEAEARREASVVGIAVGMTADYGAAQRMYVKRDYIPTGAGLFAAGSPVKYGASITVNDGLLLTFTKTLVDG